MAEDKLLPVKQILLQEHTISFTIIPTRLAMLTEFSKQESQEYVFVRNLEVVHRRGQKRGGDVTEGWVVVPPPT